MLTRPTAFQFGDPNPVFLRDPKVLHNNSNSDEYRETDGGVSRGRVGGWKIGSNCVRNAREQSSTNLGNSNPSRNYRGIICPRYFTGDNARYKSPGAKSSGELNFGLSSPVLMSPVMSAA